MGEKRKHEDVPDVTSHRHDEKRRKRGFVVGPDNLPDGIYKRKSIRENQNNVPAN